MRCSKRHGFPSYSRIFTGTRPTIFDTFPPIRINSRPNNLCGGIIANKLVQGIRVNFSIQKYHWVLKENNLPTNGAVKRKLLDDRIGECSSNWSPHFVVGLL